MKKVSRSMNAATLWRRRIDVNQVFLVKHLANLGDVMDHLRSSGIFLEEDVDFVKHGDVDRTHKETIRRFLKCLLDKQGPDAYKAFIEALNETGQRHVAKELESTDVSQVSSASAPSQAPRTAAEGRERGARAAPSSGPHKAASSEHVSEDDYLVMIIREDLEQCPQHREALNTLDQRICDKIRKHKKRDFSSFKDIYKLSFKTFIEKKADQFELVRDSQHTWVALKNGKKKKKKKKKKKQTQDQGEAPSAQAASSDLAQKSAISDLPIQSTVSTAISDLPTLSTVSTAISDLPILSTVSDGSWRDVDDDDGSEEGASDWQTVSNKRAPRQCSRLKDLATPTEAASALTTDQFLVSSLVKKHPSDTLIFRESDHVYKQDWVQFIKDVTSLYNYTADHAGHAAHILLGVQTRSSLPHQLLGLRSSTEESVYQAALPPMLFSVKPEFRYREAMCEGRRIGIVEVDNKSSRHSPSVIVSDDRAASGLRRNQLLTRNKGRNVSVEQSDQSCQSSSRPAVKGGKNQPQAALPGPQSQAVSRQTAHTSHQAALPGPQSPAVSRQTAHTSHQAALPGPQSPAVSRQTAHTSHQAALPGPQSPAVSRQTAHTSHQAALPGPQSPAVSRQTAHTSHQAVAPRSPGTAAACSQSYAQTVHKFQQGPQLPPSHQGAEAAAPSKAQALMKALNNFQRYDFVLVTGSMRITNVNVQALASAPWVAVFDFNFQGRDDGLLSMLEEEIAKRRSFSVFTWCDNCKGITEKGTQWWSLRGRRDIADSHTPDNCQIWLSKVRDKLDKLCQLLAQFAQDSTVLKLLILWPDSEVEARCLHKFVSKLQEHLPSEMIVCFPDSTKDHSVSKAATLLFTEYEDSIEKFHVDLEDFCAQVELTQTSRCSDRIQFQLPSDVQSDGSKVAILTEKADAWLVEDLDVLYLQYPHLKPRSEKHLEDEADTFFTGGTIKWSTLYDANYDHFDIMRVKASEIIQHIEKEFIKDSRGGVVTIYHAPGAGGSTMARRVLWELHRQAPCVHVKQRSGSSMEEISDKLIFLYDKCKVPVIALMDGEDESRIKQFSKQMRRHNVVIVYVKRYPYSSYSTSLPKGKFYLPGPVERKESKSLVSHYMPRCQGDQTKIQDLQKLDQNVHDKMKVQMYEYGMTVYLHEFQGVRAFVKGHLQMTGQRREDLHWWQKGLGFLALVYYYGQSSLPCQFFVGFLEKVSNYKVDLDDLPHEMKVFVVLDTNEAREQCIRIGHYIIAQEILEQILSGHDRNTSGSRRNTTSDKLSTESRRHLKDFCIEFITQATKKKVKTSVTSQTVAHILTKTFILRGIEETNDMSDQQQKRKPQFSQVMSDLDSDPPYQGRLEILQKLCQTFPYDPNFRAHLGRFYTCCRPDEEREAETHFKEALKLCRDQSSSQDVTDIDDRSKLTLMHIYHMYGMFFKVRVDKLIRNWSPQKDPRKLEEMLDAVVSNACCACDNFVDSRNTTPSGHEECYTYTNEIFVRLRTCDFVNRNFPGKMKAFLDDYDGDKTYIKPFVLESVTEIDNLIMECYEVQVDEVFMLQKYAIWFHELFSSCSFQLQKLLKSDHLANLRLTITATKLKFRHKDDIIWTDSPIPEEEITQVVSMLEDIFQEDYGDREDKNRASKVKLDLDYRDWILAIRHVQFKQDYTVERVLDRVRRWHAQCRSPQSTYYRFVLLSLLGIGTAACPGNTECLVDALILLEDMQKLSKMIQKSRFPREWLGRDDLRGIKRLVTNSNISHQDRRIQNSSRAKLAVCKGTLGDRLRKPAGFIELDLGLNTSTKVAVFFIPSRAVNVELHHAGARVQFHLAFTLDKGYEAYEVMLLERYRCLRCPQRVEMTWEQQEVLCKCGAFVTKNEHSLARPRSPEDHGI